MPEPLLAYRVFRNEVHLPPAFPFLSARGHMHTHIALTDTVQHQMLSFSKHRESPSEGTATNAPNDPRAECRERSGVGHP